MNKARLAIVSVVLSVMILSCSRNPVSVENIHNGVLLKAKHHNTSIQFYSGDIVRIIKWHPDGTSGKLSLSVILDSIPDLGIRVEDGSDTVTLQSSALTVKVSKADGKIEYRTSAGMTLLKEKDKPAFAPVVYDGDSGFTVHTAFRAYP